MKYIYVLFFCLLSGIATFLSCSKDKNNPAPSLCNVTCQHARLRIFAVGYEANELDTVIINEYVSGELTMTYIRYINDLWYTGDTTYLRALETFAAYEIKIPATNQVFYIDNFEMKGPSTIPVDCKIQSGGCTNHIDYFNLNGQKVSGYAYMKKQ